MSTVIQAAYRFRAPPPLSDELLARLHINAQAANERISTLLTILHKRKEITHGK